MYPILKKYNNSMDSIDRSYVSNVTDSVKIIKLKVNRPKRKRKDI